MKNTFIPLFIAILCYVFYAYKMELKSELEVQARQELKTQMLDDLDSIISYCATIENNIEDTKKAWPAYKNLRLCFKRQEYFLSYFDPQLYKQSLNGAPLSKVQKHVPEFIVLQAKGLQRLEELFYEDEWDKEEIITQISQFKGSMKSYRQRLAQSNLLDADIFEAFRYGIIRLNTMGINGFDSPGGSEKILAECRAILSSYQLLARSYQKQWPNRSLDKLGSISEKGIEMMAGDWEEFDHLAFLIDVIEPLWTESLRVQKELKIELPRHRNTLPQSINYEAGSLFSDDLVNVELVKEFDGGEELKKGRVALGKLLFFDPILSQSNKMACASCHKPELAFTDGLPKSIASKERFGKRNSPTLMNSIYANRFFHDLRADKLSMQVDHVVLNPDEFASNYEELITKLKNSDAYIHLFDEAYPNQGITKNAIENAIVNYVASLRSFNSEFDKYVRGESRNLSAEAKRGYNLFNGKAACATCHFSPTFAGTVPPYFDETESEVLGVPEVNQAPYVLDRDLGRYANGVIKEKAEFYKNSFKTPTLRNIEFTGPYMHNGAFETLEDVLEFYNNGGGTGLGFNLEHQTLPGDSLHLNEQEISDIIAFMKSLSDTAGFNSIPKELPEFNNVKWNQRKVGGEY